VGEAPDPRAQSAATARGYDLSCLRARRVDRHDFDRFDLVLAMDYDNREFLAGLCPPPSMHKLKMMMDYARKHRAREVPDPYAGGADAFELVLNMLEDAGDGLLQNIQGRKSEGR
jgi:protein-tyrosine phosphatase